MTERAALLGGTLDGRPETRPRLGGRRGAPAGRPEPMTIRVLIADDQEIVRAGLPMILDAQPGIEVVGEAADGREAVAARPRTATRRVPVRHPDAEPRRHRSHSSARRTRRSTIRSPSW